MGIPWRSSGEDSKLSLLGAQGQSLVRRLRSQKPCGLKKKKKKDRKKSFLLSTFMKTVWKRKWQPTPAFLPRESRGQRSLVDCCPWGRAQLDTTEVT